MIRCSLNHEEGGGKLLPPFSQQRSMRAILFSRRGLCTDGLTKSKDSLVVPMQYQSPRESRVRVCDGYPWQGLR